MAADGKEDRNTPAREPPPEGHHDAHERPKAPYGKEEDMHDEQMKQHEREQRRP